LRNIYGTAKEYHKKALAIHKEIGDREKEGSSYGSLGTVCRHLGEYSKPKEYFEKAIDIIIKIGDNEGEATDYGNLGTVLIVILGSTARPKNMSRKHYWSRKKWGTKQEKQLLTAT